MSVYAEKSSVGPDATGIPVFTDSQGNVVRSPQIPKTLAQTTVSARSGQTVVLGGLITKDLEENTRRVPFLADIPVLGRLFRFDSVTNKRTELLVILTPYLVQTNEQIDWINSREMERMSWCVADIVNIHGPVPVSGNPLFNPAATPVIFPDLAPGAPAPVVPPAMGPIWPFPPYPPGLPLPPSFTLPNQPPSNTQPPNTQNTPPPPPPAPNPMPPYVQPMGANSGPSSMPLSPPYQDSPSRSVIVPQPASLLPSPAEGGGHGALAPRPIEPVAPPVGTEPSAAGVRPAGAFMQLPPGAAGYPLPPIGPAQAAPAVYQQPVER